MSSSARHVSVSWHSTWDLKPPRVIFNCDKREFRLMVICSFLFVLFFFSCMGGSLYNRSLPELFLPCFLGIFNAITSCMCTMGHWSLCGEHCLNRRYVPGKMYVIIQIFWSLLNWKFDQYTEKKIKIEEC